MCALLLTFIQAVLWSSLQLWIAVLTRLADSMWQLVISRQCTSKHDLCVALKAPLSGCCRSTAALCPVFGLPRRPRVYRKVTDFCGCRGQSVSQRRGNLHTLMRPYSLFLVFITQQVENVCVWEREKQKLYECVMHMCNVCKLRVSVWREEVGGWVGRGWGGISTAATSSDSDVTVRVGLCRQCG